MLGEAGSIASIVGVVISLLGLGFALLQLSKLRGETRAARAAAEETRRLLRRDLTGADLARLSERIQGLIELHRDRDRVRALDRYPEIRGLLIEVRRQHPNLSEEHSRRIQSAIVMLIDIQNKVEGLTGDMSQEMVARFNQDLTELQSMLLPELEDQLE